MSIEGGLTRRALLQRGTLLGGAAVFAGFMPFPAAAKAAAESKTAVVLTPVEWATLEAITGRMLPSDSEPGAIEAGCVNFIDKALANEESAARALYAIGLGAIDGAAKASGAESFGALSTEQQDELLGELEAGKLAGWPVEAAPSPVFFEAVRAHTLIGFLADPKYGGNRDFAGWRVTHYPGPRHRRGGFSPEQMAGTAKIRTVWGDEQ